MIDATEHANPPKRGLRVRVLAGVAFGAAVFVTLTLGYLSTRYQSPTPPAIGLAIQGKTDLAAGADVLFVIAVMKGDDLGMLSSLVSVSNDSAISPARKSGRAFGTSGESFLWAYLIRHKLSPDSVTLVDVSPGRIVLFSQTYTSRGALGRPARARNGVALARGHRMKIAAKERLATATALATIGMIAADEPVGVLGLHSGETGVFDEEEMKLLHAGSLHSAAKGKKV